MKTLKIIPILIPVVLLAFASCKSEKSQKETMQQEISKLEKDMFGQQAYAMTETAAFQMIKKYEEYVQKFPQDSLCGFYLFKAGELAMNISASNQAIFFFEKVKNNYPTFKDAPLTYLFEAVIYETQVKNIDKAREYYNLFIAKYPNHPMAKDAKASMEMLGKDLNEIIKGFEAKNDSLEKVKKK